ncbi:MAG: branched-chain amino acid transport system permease protein [Acidimicrobiaceae bacterium]|nr:branched-chain amino acid transport system permease protein [Acidimicrobiaceae bacterium]MDQ1446565.1 branched-chain amino acid transport system permease protein [Acidimicrobiaceae bacterium]
MGYTLVYGVLRLINFAHSEIFMIGVFASLFSMHAMGIGPGDPTKTGLALVLVLLVTIGAGMVASGSAAVIMERVAYRPLRRRNAPRLSALITAIGISLFLQELFAVRYGRNQLGFPRVLAKRQLADVLGANVRTDKVLVFGAALVLMVGLDRFVARSRLGRGIRATAQDPETAALMGVNIDRVVLLTFLLGGLLAGAAGALYGLFFEFAKYNIGFLPGIKAFTAAVLGGIGNIRGALLGGLLLGLLENWGASVLGGEWKDVFAFAVLVLVLLFRPTGLLGEALARARA